MIVPTRPPITHELKTWPRYYGEIHIGRKMFDARLNDRDYQTGDTLVLREFDPEAQGGLGEYSGRQCERLVGYILYGGDPAVVGMEASHAGVSPGFIVMSLLPTPDQGRAKREAWEANRRAIREAQGMPATGKMGRDVGPGR